MDANALLDEITAYCRSAGIAESTFGRRSVNDGKLTHRLRVGRSVTLETAQRVRAYIEQQGDTSGKEGRGRSHSGTNSAPLDQLRMKSRQTANVPVRAAHARQGAISPNSIAENPEGNFRFFDNRQKYLLFVTTCSEKWVVAQRVGLELANIHPKPPALRLFDAGVGDGTVLTRVMRSMHGRFPNMPFYIVGKEISLEDIRLTLEKLPDRFHEHPATVLILTNMYYAEAPWLTPKSVAAASGMVWKEVGLAGNTASEFEEQLTDLNGFLAANWRATISAKSGNPIYEKPVVLVIYRDDHRFLLDQVRPRRGVPVADYDLILASQPYRLKATAQFKAAKVLGPLARALGLGGRLIAVHSHGKDPGHEIIRRIWPGEDPFKSDRHELLKATKTELGSDARYLNFNAYADERSIFRYEMHTLPNELSGSIGTSTLFAAWNAAIYVGQIEDERLAPVISNTQYLDTTAIVLRESGGLWFFDESFVISRKRD